MKHYLPEYEMDNPELENDSYHTLKNHLPPANPKIENHKILLLTHYGFIREFFYTIRQR